MFFCGCRGIFLVCRSRCLFGVVIVGCGGVFGVVVALGFWCGSDGFVDGGGVFVSEVVVDASEVFAYASVSEFVDLVDESVEELTVVADEYYRSVESLDGILEDVLRHHVEVVCGLVEDEQVDGFEEQAYHGESRAFASGEELDVLLGGFSSEHESSEDVVDAEAYFSACHVVDSLEDGEVFVEQLRLILCEVAYLYVVSHFECSRVVNLVHDALDECGLSFAVLADEGHFFSSFDDEVYVVEDGMVAVCLADFFADDGVVSCTLARGELKAQGRGVHVVDLDGHYLFELPDALLHLHGFCGLVSEAFDECFRVGYFLLLVFVGTELLFASFFSQDDVLVVLDAVVDDM